MAVITISRQVGSLGSEIAKDLSRQLGCALLDRGALERSLVEHGLKPSSLGKYDEKRPSFWELFSLERERYLNILSSVLFESALRGDCIILGRGGQVLLAQVPGVLRCWIIAPLAVRVDRLKSRLSCDEKQAEQIIRQNDHDRLGFHHSFFNVRWDSAALYDCVINTGSFSITQASALIREASRTLEEATDRAETARQLDNLCLKQRVINAILYEEKIPVSFLEVSAAEGRVTLKGVVTTSSNVERCAEAARKVSGVLEVVNQISHVENYLAV